MVSRRLKYRVWWSRSGMTVRLALLLLGALLLAAIVFWQRPLNEDAYASSNLAVFALVNLNVAILCILIFLVGRNIFRLLFDRRRRILGSKLRLRLVSAFVGLTAIPLVLLVALASGLLSRALEGWFSSPAEASVEGARRVAQLSLASTERHSVSLNRSLVESIAAWQQGVWQKQELEEYLEKQRELQGLYSIALYSEEGAPYLEVVHPTGELLDFAPPAIDEKILMRALQEYELVRSYESETSRFFRVFTVTNIAGLKMVLVTATRLDADLFHAIGDVRESLQQFQQLRLFKGPLKSVYILTLYMLAGLILFSAVWVGFFLAKQLTGPIQRLAEGTREVAKGNYDFEIRSVGRDEFGVLTRSFNQMTRDLRDSVRQAERRRVYLETLLANLGVGVMTLDRELRITNLNRAAREFFAIDPDMKVKQLTMEEVFHSTVSQQLKNFLEHGDQDIAGRVRECYLSVSCEGRERRIVCTSGRIVDREGEMLGIALLFDDITALSQAQQMAAWREAARRIAHEIKNPLTPIKLAAQRIQKLEIADPKSSSVISEASSTINDHVDSIKRLANEFSRFARMPAAEFLPTDLNQLVIEALGPYAESEGETIVFQFVSDPDVPLVPIDREQIRRLLVNMIENAIHALRTEQLSLFQTPDVPRILIRTGYDREAEAVSLEIADNGPGVPENKREAIFQPYVTHSPSGTGLGLAIVASIVSEHGGEIQVRDNQPNGVRFIIRLPLKQRVSTQRRFAPPENDPVFENEAMS